MKQNFTKQCGIMLLLMLFAFLQAAFAQKQEPKLSFSPNDKSFSSSTNDYTVTAGTAYFSRPSVTVEDNSGTPIRSKFKLIWTVEKSDGNTPPESIDEDGKHIYTDPVTGTSVQVVYGAVTIGDKVGDVKIKVTAVPMTAYADTYSTASKTYTIHVTAPEIKHSVIQNGMEITSDDTEKDPVNVYTYLDKAKNPNVYTSMKRELPKIVLWHESNDIRILDNDKYNISYKFADGDKFEVVTKDSCFIAKATEIGSATDEVKGTLTITATHKDGVDANIYKDITETIHVKAKFLDGTKKLKTYIKFVKNGKETYEQTHYRIYRDDNKQTIRQYKTPVEMPYAVVVDELGNNVTDAYVLSYGSYKDGKFQNGLVYGQDVIHKYSADPLDAYGGWKDYKNVANEAAIGVSSHTSDATYSMAGVTSSGLMASTHPDDYIVTVKAYVKNPNNQKLHDLGWWVDADGTSPNFSTIYEDTAEATSIDNIKGMLYSTDNTNEYTNLKSNNLVFHVMKRAAEIQFTPDPSSVTLANGAVMTPVNRFHVLGILKDNTMPALRNDSIKLNGSKNFYGGDDGFSYCVFIPSDRLWKQSDTKTPEMVMIDINKDNAAAVEEDVEQLVPEIGSDGKETGNYVKVKGNRYFSKENWGNDDLKMTFYGEGNIPMYYNLIPYNSQNWDISQSKAYVFNIAKAEPTRLVVDPKETYTAIHRPSVPPTFKVVDQFGVDISSHFTFNVEFDASKTPNGSLQTTYEDPHTKEIKSNFGSYTPNEAGRVAIKVTATKRENDDTKFANPDNTEVYYVTTKEGWDDPKATYEIIYDDKEFDATTGVNDDVSKTKMGKLHFIKEGGMYPGVQAFQEVPGINITFGTPQEDGKYEVKATTFDTTNDSKLKDNDNDVNGANGKRCLIEIPNVTFGKSADGMGIIPATAYIRIDAVTNGWLTIDGNFDNTDDKVYSKYYTLKNLTTGKSQDLIIGPGKSEIGEYRYPSALLAGNSYALYCIDGMEIHGIDFDPAFISLSTDHGPWHTAITFQNGYTGNLPKLRDGQYATVSYYLRDINNGGGTEVTDITNGEGKHAVVDKSTGHVSAKSLTSDGSLTTSNKAEMENRVGIVAKVLGKKYDDGKQVEKRPHYNLFIGDMPTYIVSDYEEFDQGNRLSTTNIPTRIWMTIGGWKHGMTVQDDFPYYKNNDPNSTALADSWNEAKMDSTGRDNMTVDNFNYQVTGTQNPVDENVTSWTSGKHNTFNVPVRGTYLKFEPEESGQLFVYVLQNGMSDLATTDVKGLQQAVAQHDGNDPKNKQAYRLRRRAMYIIDETGQNVELKDGNDSWGGMDKYLPGTATNKYPGYTYPNKNYYTEGMLRIGWNYDAVLGGNHTLTFAKEGENADSLGDFRKYPKDRETIETWWKNKVTYGSQEHDRVNGPLEVLKLQDGSYAIPTKGYVRYTFNVKSGKTYYMFVSGSKLGFCGFGFLPVGYTSNAESWINKATGDKSEDERSFASTVLSSLPEPDADVYKNDNIYGGDDITLSATNFATSDGSYHKLSDAIKKRSFVNVTLKRTFLNKRWAGICLPFSVSQHQVKEIFGEGSSIITFDSIRADKNGINPVTGEKEDQSRTIHFTRHVAQIIEAGRPYFIYPSVDGVEEGKPIGTKQDDGSYALTFKHVSFENKDTMNVIGFNDEVRKYNKTAEAGKKIDIFTYKACGIYDAASAPQYSYFMKTSEKEEENYLSRLVSDNANKRILYGYNTYLYPYSDDAEGDKLVETTNKAKMATFWIRGAEVNGGETTDIDEINGLVDQINIDQTNFVRGVYTIDGVRVRQENSLKGLAPGIYIMGGKEYTVK